MPPWRVSSAMVWDRAMERVDTPVPPEPVRAATDPRHAAGAGRVSRSEGSTSPRRTGWAQEVRAATISSRPNVGASTRAAPSSSQSRVARPSSTTSTAHPAARAAATRSRSTAGRPASATRAENARPEASRARTSSAEMQRTNSAGRAPLWAQRPTLRNQPERAGARPRTT